jgi:hypothetical protein
MSIATTRRNTLRKTTAKALVATLKCEKKRRASRVSKAPKFMGGSTPTNETLLEALRYFEDMVTRAINAGPIAGAANRAGNKGKRRTWTLEEARRLHNKYLNSTVIHVANEEGISVPTVYNVFRKFELPKFLQWSRLGDNFVKVTPTTKLKNGMTVLVQNCTGNPHIIIKQTKNLFYLQARNGGKTIAIDRKGIFAYHKKN